MKVTLMPYAVHEPNKLHPVICIEGETISYNGFDYDLSPIPDGAEVEAEHPAVGTIKRVNGIINISLAYPYDATKAQLCQSTDINDYTFDIIDDFIPCPIIWKEELEGESDV